MILADTPELNIVRGDLEIWLDAKLKSNDIVTGTQWSDLSGNGNNGTLNSSPTYSSDGGGSVVFDGIDDYISVPNVLDTMPTSISFFAWVNLDSLGTTTGVFSKNNISSEDRFYLLISSTGYVLFDFEEDNGGYTRAPSTTSPLVVGEWSQIGVTWSNIDGIKIWKNGVNIYTAAAFTTLPRDGSYTDFWIGAAGSASPGLFIDGKISKATLYNKALSQTEIQHNYKIQKVRYE